jgi:stage V sporulation protein D (sporulation-specific penicillin-binding protein)
VDENSLQRSRRRRLRIFLIVTLLAGAKLAWSLFDIQVLRHASFEARAQNQQERRIGVPARRGAIYDRNGTPLAVNRERNAVYLVPNHVRDPRAFVDSLAAILPVSRDEIRTRLARGGFYVPLLRSVDREAVRRLEAADLAGVGVETANFRAYPHGRLAAAVIGQVDIDNHGIGGLELQYDALLRGVDGWTVHQRDAMGREYANFAFPMVQPVDGSDVFLTLDVGLQEIAEEALDEGLTETRAATGSLIIVDPRTGEVLAMANRPDADPNTTRTPLKNYAVVDMYEPGSTFKLVTLSGLYENRLARPD